MSTTSPDTADTAQTSDPVALLTAALQRAIVAVLGEEYANADPVIRPAQDARFGDFQANGAMALAKQAAMKPRELAERIVEAADVSAVAEPPEIAGPGFINIRLKSDALATMLEAMDDAALGVTPSTDPHPVAIDLCGVNVAKQSHVGHLRSTVIGDCLARVFMRRGRTVHRQNHLGDWGLPIAMVLYQLREQGADFDRMHIADLDAAYRDAQLTIKRDDAGLSSAERHGAGPHRMIELAEQNAGAEQALNGAKQTLVKLQNNDPQVTADWNKLIEVTMRAVYESLDMLGVPLAPEHERGESFYREKLPNVVDAFVREGLAEEDQGAIVVRFPDRERPLLIRKSDGGFLYATTDLAAIRYRVQELGADRVIYVVDARQRDHFRDVFEAARMIGWHILPDGTEAELIHIPFGAVLGKDKKPLKTRSGENITLRELLIEAIERGTAEVERRAADPDAPTHGLSTQEIARIGQAVGIGAVKYADLSSDLVRDYVFDFDRMLAFEGNTGPYLQYAHARICSIFARGGEAAADFHDAALHIGTEAEKQLALKLLRYGDMVEATAHSLEPHRICTYLYELANAYSAFYQACPVLKAETEALVRSRLRVCDLVRRVLADGLHLLGIEAPRRM